MFLNLGEQVRTLRKNRGYSIQEFAALMNVSSGYISNLETGKTETIHLTFLNRLQEEFSFFPILWDDNHSDFRLYQLLSTLSKLEKDSPELAEHLLQHIEVIATLANK